MWIFAAILMITPPARAHLRDRCTITLTTLMTKGPTRASFAWRHFNSPRVAIARPTPAERIKHLHAAVAALGRALERPLVAATVEDDLREIARDLERPERIVTLALRTARWAALREPVRLLSDFALHPNLRHKTDVFQLVLNPSVPIDRAQMATLVRDLLEAEWRGSVRDDDVPPGADELVQLHVEKRLTTAVTLEAFNLLIQNPRATPHGVRRALEALERWAESLYVSGRRLPPPELTHHVLDGARRRLHVAPGAWRADALIARVDGLLR